jgi:hypothetical protein
MCWEDSKALADDRIVKPITLEAEGTSAVMADAIV